MSRNVQNKIFIIMMSAMISFFVLSKFIPHEASPYNGPAIVTSKIVAEFNDQLTPKTKKELARASREFSDKEINCLARNIYFEARDQTVFGQDAVAWVTLNRMEHKNWPGTICGVVWQRKQFSWTHDGKSDKPREKAAWDLAKSIARIAIKEYQNGGRDQANGALYYHADYAHPYWSHIYTQVATVDSHIFYK